MEEEIYFGEYVFISRITEGIEEVIAGKLEKMTIGEDNSYKIFLEESYELVKNNYTLIKRKAPILKSIPIDNYLGITPATKGELNKFYSECNDEINKSMEEIAKKNESTKPKVKTSKDRYKELGNTGNNFYSHKTKIGFMKN